MKFVGKKYSTYSTFSLNSDDKINNIKDIINPIIGTKLLLTKANSNKEIPIWIIP
jgi:hypothetical protein